jgi:hypothetical protein
VQQNLLYASCFECKQPVCRKKPTVTRIASGCETSGLVACKQHRKSVRYSKELNSLERAQAKRQRLDEKKLVRSDIRYQEKDAKITSEMPDYYVITYFRSYVSDLVRYVVPRDDPYLRVVGDVLAHGIEDPDWEYYECYDDGDSYRLHADMGLTLKNRLAHVLLNGCIPRGITRFAAGESSDEDDSEDISGVDCDEAKVLAEAEHGWQPYLVRDFNIVNTVGSLEFVHVQ